MKEPVPKDWKPADSLIKFISHSLHIDESTVLKLVPSFVSYNTSKNNQYYDIGQAFYKYTQMRSNYSRSDKSFEKPSSMNSATEGFFVASDDFTQRYRELGYEQYHPDRPWTWKKPGVEGYPFKPLEIDSFVDIYVDKRVPSAQAVQEEALVAVGTEKECGHDGTE